LDLDYTNTFKLLVTYNNENKTPIASLKYEKVPIIDGKLITGKNQHLVPFRHDKYKEDPKY
jgi:hypothetical protein